MRQGANIRQEELGGGAEEPEEVFRHWLAGGERCMWSVMAEGDCMAHWTPLIIHRQVCVASPPTQQSMKEVFQKKRSLTPKLIKVSEQENIATFKMEATQSHNQNVFVHNLPQQQSGERVLKISYCARIYLWNKKKNCKFTIPTASVTFFISTWTHYTAVVFNFKSTTHESSHGKTSWP